MLTNEIKILLDELSYDDLKAICNYCHDKIDSKRSKDLKTAIEQVSGLNIDGKSRTMYHTFLRAMFTYQMSAEGFTDAQIAETINKDRTTIIYLRKKWQHVMKYPQLYPDIMPYWNKFQKIILQK